MTDTDILCVVLNSPLGALEKKSLCKLYFWVFDIYSSYIMSYDTIISRYECYDDDTDSDDFT
jgi:hypothetical protein